MKTNRTINVTDNRIITSKRFEKMIDNLLPDVVTGDVTLSYIGLSVKSWKYRTTLAIDVHGTTFDIINTIDSENYDYYKWLENDVTKSNAFKRLVLQMLEKNKEYINEQVIDYCVYRLKISEDDLIYESALNRIKNVSKDIYYYCPFIDIDTCKELAHMYTKKGLDDLVYTIRDKYTM